MGRGHDHIRGLSWDSGGSRAIALALGLALIASLAFVPARSETAPAGTIDVIVRETDPASSIAEDLVTALSGTITRQLTVIGGFAATIPTSALDALAGDPAVLAATPDGTVDYHTVGWEDSSILATVDFRDYPGSLYTIARSTNAADAWGKGATGFGVDVALIDTGVAPVQGMPAWKVLNGADLSFESQSDSFRYLDTYGHGTHMAGIIAGLDVAMGDNYSLESKDSFIGMAPLSRIVNVKVGAHDGAVDVSQVIAAVDWVIQHRNDTGVNIRVLNLSFGTDSTQDYVLDPLAYAVEQAWKAGIVVVVAAGNDGNGNPLRNPASDPYVIAVGSTQVGDFNTGNNAMVSYDRVSTFSNCGTAARGVDLLAPGKSITSFRVPGSFADDSHPEARVGTRFFIGSGTSQAAAVVSGAAAQLLSLHPTLSPDEVKAYLMEYASPLGGVTAQCQGAGVLDLGFVSKRLPKLGVQKQAHEQSNGLGSLEAARGTDHLTMAGVELRGEVDIMGSAWHGFNRVETVCTTQRKGKVTFVTCEDQLIPVTTLWDGGDWNGTSWSGTSWSGTSWSGTSWSGTSWSGTSWSGTSWSGTSWSDKTWLSGSWSSGSWSGTSWTSGSWSGTSWTSADHPAMVQGASWR